MTICCPCCSAKIQISCMCCLLASFSSLVVNKGASYWISPFWGEIYHFFSHHNKKNRNLSLISLSSTLVGLQRFPRAKKQIWRGRPLVAVHRGHRWLLVVGSPSQPPELRNQFPPGAPLEFVRGVQRWWWRAVSGEQTK